MGQLAFERPLHPVDVLVTTSNARSALESPFFAIIIIIFIITRLIFCQLAPILRVVLDVHDDDGHREEERVLRGKMCLLSFPSCYFLFPLFCLFVVHDIYYLTMRATYQIHFMLEP